MHCGLDKGTVKMIGDVETVGDAYMGGTEQRKRLLYKKVSWNSCGET